MTSKTLSYSTCCKNEVVLVTVAEKITKTHKCYKMNRTYEELSMETTFRVLPTKNATKYWKQPPQLVTQNVRAHREEIVDPCLLAED